MRKFWIMFLAIAPVLMASLHSYLPLSSVEMMELKLSHEGKTLVTLDKGWRLTTKDDQRFAAPDFDDSGWTPVEINTPLTGELNKGKVWYRVDFTLDAPLSSGVVELYMGCISAGDEVYLNGELRGSYGFATVVNGSSTKERRYLVSEEDSKLRVGRNVIAIRVKNGYLHGMHRGIPQIRFFPGEAVFGRLSHRSAGQTAVFRQITEVEAINRFAPGERLFLRPQIGLFGKGENLDGVLRVVLEKDGRQLEKQELSASLKRGHWLFIPPFEFRNPGVGRYHAESLFEAGGKVLWSNRVTLKVEEIPDYFVAVNAELAKAAPTPLSVKIGDCSFGSFGPRDLDAQGKLVDNYKTPEARAGLGAVIGTNPKYPGPVFIHSNVKSPGAAWQHTDFIDNIGGYYDGVIDGWPAGWVRPENAGQLKQISTQETNWTGKTIRFQYEDGAFLDLRFSQLSPAFELSGTCTELRLLENGWGVGGPSLIFGENAGEWRDLGKNIDGLETNYLMLSFKGAQGWEEFDIPYIIVFEKKPSGIRLTDNGLSVRFSTGGCGHIMLMPLYGVTLCPPDSSGADALERCRFWSRALPAMPIAVSRTASIDYASDTLLFRDEFTRKSLTDEWNTPRINLAPVPPSLVLASYGNLNLSFSQAVLDTHYATLCGPFCAMTETDNYVFAIKGLTRLVTEVRSAGKLTDNEDTRNARQELENIVNKDIMPSLESHPWRRLTAHPSGKARSSGLLEPDFTNLMMSFNYLPEELRVRILREVTAEQHNFFDNSLKTAVRLGGKEPSTTLVPVNKAVSNPLSGKAMNIISRHANDNGIDGPCYEGLRLHLAWSLGHYAQQWEFVESRLPELELSYNLVVNSLDWAYSLSWDSYGGLRIGNGLQESTIMHAGLLGYARLLHHLGRPEQSDQAACLALLLVPGMLTCTVPATCDYNRRHRGYLMNHSKSDDIAFIETNAPDRYNEVNERGGFFLWHIYPRNSFNSGIIMTHLPEVLRLFKEYWGDFSDRHFSGGYDGRMFSRDNPMRLDVFCFAVPHPPFPVDELLRLRQRIDFDCWQRLADQRAFLDYNSQISWEKLW